MAGGLKASLDKFKDLDASTVSKPASPGDTTGTSSQPNSPKLHSAPGGMAAFSGQLRAANDTVRKLEERLKQHEGSVPTLRIDARRVRFSRSANRHEQHWKTGIFRIFKEDLKSSGGNVVPVLVRPVSGDPDADFEVTYGHRRTKACQEEGLPLLAIVQPLTDLEHWLAMARENMHREDLTPYELGDMYVNALHDKFFENAAQLAVHFEKSRAHVSQAIKLRNLPQVVLDAFPSPYDLQYRWSDELSLRLAANPKPILDQAKLLAKKKGALSGAQVFAALCPSAKQASMSPLKIGERIIGRTVFAKGRLQIQFEPNVIAPDRIPDLAAAITDFLRAK